MRRATDGSLDEGGNMRDVWRLLMVAIVLGGCGVRAKIPGATLAGLDNPNRALVLGRVQVFRAGQQVRVGPVGHAEESGVSGGDRTLAEIRFRNLSTNRSFSYDVTDDEGGFEVFLPPGQYAVTLRYFTWTQATPARFEVDGGGRYYIGTLRVSLLKRWSMGGMWARTFGGTIPEKDSDFSVVDQWDWAEAHLPMLTSGQVRAEKRLMRLGELTPHAAAFHRGALRVVTLPWRPLPLAAQQGLASRR